CGGAIGVGVENERVLRDSGIAGGRRRAGLVIEDMAAVAADGPWPRPAADNRALTATIAKDAERHQFGVSSGGQVNAMQIGWAFRRALIAAVEEVPLVCHEAGDTPDVGPPRDLSYRRLFARA